MPDDTTQDGMSQTAGSEGADQTDETYTKAQLSEMILKEVGKVTAKHAKKYDALAAELEAEKRKHLPDPEKVKAELADKDKAISQKDMELIGARLEATKLRALMKAGAPADKVDALLKRVVGSTPEEIEADVAELAGLGLLAAKTPNGAQGAGNPGIQDHKEPDLWTQIAEAEKVAIKSGSAEDWKKVNRLKAKAYKF